MADKKPTCWELFDMVLPLVTRLLLWGPPGTGKTYQAIFAHLRQSQAVVSLTLTEDTPAAELRGHYLPVEGRFEWRDGSGIQAWRDAARLVINEFDHAGPDALSQLIALLDDPETARLTLPTGETVRPAAGVTVVATMNGEPDALPVALRDRFPIAIHVDAVHPKALESLAPDLRKAARETVVLPPERRLSIRAWQSFDLLRKTIGEPNAAHAVFDGRANDVLDALKLARA